MLSRRSFLGKSVGTGVAAVGLLGLGSKVASAAPSPLTLAQAQQGSRLYDVLKRGKVIVGTGGSNPPWHFEDESGNLQGMDIEMAEIPVPGLV